MNESELTRQRIQPSVTRRAISSSVSAILGVTILFFGPFFAPAWLISLASYETASTGIYWTLCWSESIWEPFFPAPPGYSAPSAACYLAMLVTDVVVAAGVLFILLTLATRTTNGRNA